MKHEIFYFLNIFKNSLLQSEFIPSEGSLLKHSCNKKISIFILFFFHHHNPYLMQLFDRKQCYSDSVQAAKIILGFHCTMLKISFKHSCSSGYSWFIECFQQIPLDLHRARKFTHQRVIRPIVDNHYGHVHDVNIK